MDPRDPLPFRTDAPPCSTSSLPTAIDELARIAGPGSALTLVEFRHIGGALGAPRAGRGARATLPGKSRAQPGRRARRRPSSRPSRRSLDAAGRRGRAVPRRRLPELRRWTPTDASGFFDADTWDRLQRVKAHYDPRNLFRGNHQVPPAAAN